DVVDDLRVDVLEAAEHREARTLRRALDLVADAKLAALATLNLAAHDYLPPFAALPAFSRTFSPWHRTPLPPYGSGGRNPRIFAAVWPIFSLSAPVRMMMVPLLSPGISTLLPSGLGKSTGREKPSE